MKQIILLFLGMSWILTGCFSSEEVPIELIAKNDNGINKSKSVSYFHDNQQQNDDWYQVKILSDTTKKYILEFDNSQTDWIDVIRILDTGEKSYLLKGGDKVAFSRRKVKHRNTLLVNVDNGPFEVNVRNRGGYLIPVHAFTIGSFLAMDLYRSTWIGIGLGTVLVFLLVSFGAFISIFLGIGGDRSSLYYKSVLYYWLFTFFTFLFFLEELGYADQYLWPHHPDLEETAIFFIILGSMISLCLLVFRIFLLKDGSLILIYCQRLLLGLGSVFMLLLPLGILQNNTSFTIFYNSVLIYVVLVFLFVIWAGFSAIRRQVPYAIFFFSSFLILILGSLMKPLSLVGAIPLNYFVQYGGFIGQIINIIALAILFIWQYFKDLKESMNLQSQINYLERTALQAQMNPHFIFNSLNSVQNYIAKNDQLAAMDFLSKFALLIRKTLNVSGQKFISLQEEIHLLRGYLEMEQLRFKDRFDYQIKIDPALDLTREGIPPLMIQPFVENSIIHAFKGISRKGYIYIGFIKNEEFLAVEIMDNGRGFQNQKTQTHKSLAMDITAKRIVFNNLRDHKSDYQIISNNEEFGKPGTTVNLIIKLKKLNT